MRTMTLTVLLGLALLVGCSGDQQDSDSEVTEEATVGATAEEEGARGSLEDPVPVGVAIPLEAWEVTVEGAHVEGETLDGSAKVVARVEATRTTGGMGTLASMEGGVLFRIMGGSGVSISSTCVPDEGSLDMTAEVTSGATVSGLICSAVPPEEVEGAVWMVKQHNAGDDVFVATGL